MPIIAGHRLAFFFIKIMERITQEQLACNLESDICNICVVHIHTRLLYGNTAHGRVECETVSKNID